MRIRNSIQQKILIYFSIVIFIGLSILTFIAYNITEQNTKSIIKNDMTGAKRNLDIYVNQYFLFSNIEISENTMTSEAENISKQLSTQMGNNIDIYDLKGNKVSYGTSLVADNSKDLKQAINGEISYTTNFVGEKAIVSLSYPIKNDNVKIGIIRYYKDYTELYNYNKKFKNIINFFAALIFVVIFVTSFVIAKQITKPIKKLTEAAEEVSKGNFNIDVNINSENELGYLSSRFNMMVHKIGEQIEIIKNDRDTLDRIQNQNKHFFDNVTHELKTPITTITGYAQAIEDLGIRNDDFTKKGIKCIISESNRLNNMVIELLELSKVSSKNFNYNFDFLDIGELIRETCDEMAMKGRKYRISIECSIQDNLCLKGDRDRLKEVLINLIDNSIKYGSVNSKISVVAYRKQNDIVVIVKDQGEGIPEDLIEKIFDPFYRVSKKVSRELGSAGLGLSIVREIVEKHNGKIEIKSKLKYGTEVILNFIGDVL